ncbi:hypothetical protein QBC40DRAFT_258922 [Triangularia verruculosa]|uniref:Uncharacterized protein n=1 Tax=Triangularia verruculosa TaxID=2587418 RepID=A0AAN6X7F3_9PEZI|nr:hypothetical protein QBC40DRAFT_258922 [Triangularia verruculosa]
MATSRDVGATSAGNNPVPPQTLANILGRDNYPPSEDEVTEVEEEAAVLAPPASNSMEVEYVGQPAAQASGLAQTSGATTQSQQGSGSSSLAQGTAPNLPSGAVVDPQAVGSRLEALRLETGRQHHPPQSQDAAITGERRLAPLKRGREDAEVLGTSAKRSNISDGVSKPQIAERPAVRHKAALADDPAKAEAVAAFLAEPGRYRLHDYNSDLVANYKLKPPPPPADPTQAQNSTALVLARPKGDPSTVSIKDATDKKKKNRASKSKRGPLRKAKESDDWEDIEDDKEGVHVLQSRFHDLNWVSRPKDAKNILNISMEPTPQALQDMCTTLMLAVDAAGPNSRLQIRAEVVQKDVMVKHYDNALKEKKLYEPCVGCQSFKHPSRSCAAPDPDTGYRCVLCPLCYSTEHYLEYCPKMKGLLAQGAEGVRTLYTKLYKQCINKPPFYSGWLSPWDFVPDALEILGQSAEEIDVLTLTPTWQQEDIRTRCFPWSLTFGRRIAAAGDHDPILRGAVHPRIASHEQIKTGKLPVEPRELTTRTLLITEWLMDFVLTTDEERFPTRLGFPSAKRVVPEELVNGCAFSVEDAWSFLGQRFMIALRKILEIRNGIYNHVTEESPMLTCFDGRNLSAWPHGDDPMSGAAPAEDIPIDIVSLGIFEYSWQKASSGHTDRAVLTRTVRDAFSVYTFDVEALVHYINQWLDEVNVSGLVFRRPASEKVYNLDKVGYLVFKDLWQKWLAQWPDE